MFQAMRIKGYDCNAGVVVLRAYTVDGCKDCGRT